MKFPLLLLAALAPFALTLAAPPPYTIQLDYAKENEKSPDVSILIPGTLSCFKIPAPSVKSNSLLLTPQFSDTACSDLNNTYVGGESNGMEVNTPALCNHWPFPKCPNAGIVSVRVKKVGDNPPTVSCTTEAPALGPEGWKINCTGPFNATDGVSAVRFVATVLRNTTTA